MQPQHSHITDEKHGRGVIASLDMLDAFGSVGVRFFDITHTNLAGQKRGFRPKQSLEESKRSMPFLVPSSFRRQNNLIVRPHSPPSILLVQLDDLDTAKLARLQDIAFLVLCTSPGNFQAWVAVGGAGDADFARRLRKGTGADPTASGATRTAGTANFKPKYAPSFPIVAIQAAQFGHIAPVVRLEALGLVSPPETAPKPPTGQNSSVALPLTRRARGTWPSYQICLARAPLSHGGDRPDISRADFTWCMTALDWGWSVEDVIARLMDESAKAREEGTSYAHLTVTKAAAAVLRRRGGDPAP